MSHKSSKTAEEKLAIVLEGLKGGTTVSDLCRKYGLSQAVYYKWRDKFLDGGKRGLMNSGELSLINPDKSKLEEYEKVIGRQTIEIQILKKKLESDLNEEEFISSMKQEGYSVSLICKIIKLPQSSYYRKRSGITTQRSITNKKAARIEQESSLLEKIKQVKAVHLYWGYRRVRAYLKMKLGISVSYNRVYRLMKKNDLLVERKRYKAKRTPQKDKPKPVKINQWWGADMTKFYVQSFGWVYLVIVLDWFSKKIVGYKLNIRSKAIDWVEALNMAVDTNCPLGSREYELHLMSDNGSQPIR